MQVKQLREPMNIVVSPGGWKARVQSTPRPYGGPGLCCGGRLPPTNAMAGVGLQVPTSTSSASGNLRHSGLTSSSGQPQQQQQRAPNGPLQTLVRAAKEARVLTSAPPADPLEVSSRLQSTRSWPALQVLALQYQGRLDQASMVAFFRRAAQLGAAASSTSASPSASDKYACSRLLESLALSCAPLVPDMGPATVAALLGTLGALAACGLVDVQGVPYPVVALVQALLLASLPQLHALSGAQLAFSLRGCVLLCPGGLPEVWLDEWLAAAGGPVVAQMPPQALEAVLSSLQELYTVQGWSPGDQWLSDFLRALEGRLGDYDGQGLRRLAVGLAGLEVRPHSDWLGAFRGAFDSRVAAAEMEAHDVAGVLYAFTKLQVAFA
ncbi:hypothetical protein Agub_g7546 [Astrephomene gubernaculifera]|uniref:Uncharacterized protein n=1 Tax=Astrephomene gubernaculifera TaxID=47775 RepID=A0AAD3DQB0_9CHLO|nr:hypothetical protein Agub_g7546 [Astrephomene gubernaculifera]